MESDEGGQWQVIRTDDLGNAFTVRGGMTQEDARKLAAEMTLRGHKQSYDAAQTAALPEPEAPRLT